MSNYFGAAKTKGYLKNTDTGKVVNFIYNPNSFSDNTGVTFSEISAPGSSYPKYTYVGGQVRSIALDIYLHDHSGKKLDEFKNFLEDFMPVSKGMGKFSKPPSIIFAFGPYVKTCILETMNREFTDFDRDLKPVEMTISLGLKVIM